MMKSRSFASLRMTIVAERRLTIAVVAASIAMTTAGAQKAPACKVDSTASWFVKQREWLDDSKHSWTDDTVRTKLLRAAGIEGTRQTPLQMGWEIQDGAMPAPLNADESAVVTQLRTLASTRGAVWPTKSVAGAMSTRAVWLLAHRDTALARAALKRMMEAGPEESNAADVATLEDRLRLQSGRKQIYGTQFRVRADGRLALAPMEDSAHVDLRREDAGLPPFKMSACMANGAIAKRK
jgi:hypothetical protein